MLDSMTHITRSLADMDEPFVRYKTLLHLYGRAPDSREIRILRDEVRESTLARTLLAEQDASGRIPLPALDRWRGTHWVLYMLADIGSAAGDKSLFALRDQAIDELFASDRTEPVCGAIEGNALYYLHFLALDQGQTDELAARLIESLPKKMAKAQPPSAKPYTPCAASPYTRNYATSKPPTRPPRNSPNTCSPIASIKKATANPSAPTAPHCTIPVTSTATCSLPSRSCMKPDTWPMSAAATGSTCSKPNNSTMALSQLSANTIASAALARATTR